jgi:Xaa-Pro dipeptidase
MPSRRAIIQAAAALPALFEGAPSLAAARPDADLKPLTGDTQPIGVSERLARVARLQELLDQARLGALLIEPGATLEYFTGIRWRFRLERTTAAVIPARGPLYVVTPAFEEPSVRETLQVPCDVRTWNEHESPFERLVQCLRDAGVKDGRIAVEPTTRYFIIDGIQQVSSAYQVVSGDAVVRACRLIKSPAELEIMRVANMITWSALRHVHAKTEKGMTGEDLNALYVKATKALGGSTEDGLALVNEASAYPHGSLKRQTVNEGSVILMDCGGTLHGYWSDITRSWVFGEPTARQRKVWSTVKRGQEIALETAKPGVPAGRIDDAVRKYYESEGWGPGYRLPGLSHRTGHGIGLDVHESAYLVHGDATPLEVGMCFSDEPGIYIPGEFGIRLEDCWHVTADGAQTFTPLATSIERPF